VVCCFKVSEVVDISGVANEGCTGEGDEKLRVHPGSRPDPGVHSVTPDSFGVGQEPGSNDCAVIVGSLQGGNNEVVVVY
jgi:hypothetical protein